MPYFAIGSDGKVVEKFSRQKQAVDAYDSNKLIHFVVNSKDSRVISGEVPDDLNLDDVLAAALDKPKPTRQSGGQRGGRGCPVCKIPMVAGLPAPDAKNLKGSAYRKCPQCDYTRWHPIAHVAMLLAETGWPTYRDTLGGGQRAARRVIELNMEGVPGPDAYAQTVEESKTWEGWAPGREAQRALDAEKRAAAQAAKAAEKEAKAAERAAAKEAKAAERQAEREAKAAERAAQKAEKAKAKADAAEIDGQETIEDALAS